MAQDELTSATLLRGKAAIITGAAGGLGRAMARGLVAAGADVALVDVKQAELAQAISELEPGGRAIAITADLSNSSDLQRIVEKARDAFGHIDILINNAGLGSQIVRSDYLERHLPFWELSEAVTRHFFDVNAIAPYVLATKVVGEMIERKWGRIINVTTSLDTMLRPGFAGYGGSKAGLEAHSAIMAGDLKGTGVTVNVLVPGGMADTPMVPFADRSALLRPEIMIPPAVFLCSDFANEVTARRFRASAWNSGTSLREVAKSGGDPIAWSALGSQAVNPASWMPPV